jgi:hypothetical protein
MPQYLKNSFKWWMLYAIYNQGLFSFTSGDMLVALAYPGFPPRAISMNLMRYAKHGLLKRIREGRHYRYYTNDNTYKAYCYYFGLQAPQKITLPRITILCTEGTFSLPPPRWAPFERSNK